MTKEKIIADMHTHSQFSPDAKSTLEGICEAQIKKGTKIFAVTDHCNGCLFGEFDIFEPITKSYAEVQRVKNKYKNECLIIAGIEIDEGNWIGEEYGKICNALDYDVIIGSVHAVKFENDKTPYSMIDFSEFSEEQLLGYMDIYFEEMLDLIDKTNFDILAHLTCPLRYINGKYHRNYDIKPHTEKIEQILKIIISKGIALEINTSSFANMGVFMPDEKIISRYFELGGRRVTLGSDAHIEQNVSINFDEAIKLLKKIGFKDICYFKERKIYNIEI